MYRSVLRPRWLIGHVLVIAAVVVMVNLGFWQLRRLDERREFNRELEMRADASPLGYDEIRSGDASDLSLRRARLRGVYDTEQELLVRFRARAGVPGFYVLTPLVVGSNEAVVVNRGWVPLAMGEDWPHPRATAPDGEVTVTGIVRAPEPGPLRLAPGEGQARAVGAIAIDEMEDVVGYELASVYLAETGDQGRFPLPVPPADLGEGPHLSYAMQWFAFSLTAIAVWSILVWRAARRSV